MNVSSKLAGRGQSFTTKSAAVAQANRKASSRTQFIGDYRAASAILRGPGVVQGGSGVQAVRKDSPDDITLFYLDGEAHRRRRASIARYFSPKSIRSRYEPMMHRCPGAQLAMREARIFLDRLMRLPGLQLVSEPELGWFRPISSYVIDDFIVSCKKEEEAPVGAR